MGLLAAAAFLCVGVAVPLIISKVSGNTGDEIRGQSGELAALVLENIRGLNETIQYGKGNERMELMNSRTDALSQKQSALNKLTGTNIAIANTFMRQRLYCRSAFTAAELWISAEYSFRFWRSCPTL